MYPRNQKQSHPQGYGTYQHERSLQNNKTDPTFKMHSYQAQNSDDNLSDDDSAVNHSEFPPQNQAAMKLKNQVSYEQDYKTRPFQGKPELRKEASPPRLNNTNYNPYPYGPGGKKNNVPSQNLVHMNFKTQAHPKQGDNTMSDFPKLRKETYSHQSNNSNYDPPSYGVADDHHKYYQEKPFKTQIPSQQDYKTMKDSEERTAPRKKTIPFQSHYLNDNLSDDNEDVIENLNKLHLHYKVPVTQRTQTLPEQADWKRNIQERSEQRKDASYSFSKDAEDKYPRSRAMASEMTQPSQKQVSKMPKPREISPWKDKKFPHEDLSIFGEYEDPESWEELQDFWGAVWKSILNTHELFVDKIEAKDVIQDNLGDCYFQAPASGLAEKVGRIQTLIRRKPDFPDVFEMRCYYMGEKITVELDSYFPFIKNKRGEWVTISGTNGNESWFLLVEKGFAKIFGSYAAIGGGDPREAMRFLTGAPTESFPTAEFRSPRKADLLWNKLTESHEYLWTCGIGKKPPGLDMKKLVDNHVYTILRAFRRKSDGVLILVIRNPWGKRDGDGFGEWEGDYSEENVERWGKMTEGLPFGLEKADDGIFLMSLQDFLIYFDYAAVCYLHSGFIHDSKYVKSETGTKTTEKNFEVTVKGRETTFFIMVNQESKRKFPKSPESESFPFQPSLITFNVSDRAGERYSEDDRSEDKEQTWKKFTLSPGTYKIAIKINWSNFAIKNGIDHFVVNTYGPRNVELRNEIV